MNTVLLQLTGRSLKLTRVKTAGKLMYFEAPDVFDLPDALLGGRALENIPNLAAFVCNRIQNTPYAGKPFLFCLDDEHVVTKEYKHPEAKQADLMKLARLEAETVVKEDVDGYVVLTDGYRRLDAATGKLKSVLYAVPSSLVLSIYQEFKKRGVRIERIMPSISGLLYACKKSLGLFPQSWPYVGKTVAVVDAGREKLRLLIYASGTPIFQREFDSVYEDILEILHSGASVTYEEAANEMKHGGFLLTAGQGRFGEEVSQSIGRLLDTAVGEVVRSMRVVLSSERLELNQIIFCGAVSAHPDFEDYVARLSLGVPCETVEKLCSPQVLGIALENQTVVAGFHPGDFFTLKGLVTAQKEDSIDFLIEENTRRGNRQVNFLILLIITVAAVIAMALEPLVYQGDLLRQKRDQATLANPQFKTLQTQTAQVSQKKEKLKQLEADRAALPNGKSKSAEILAQVQKQIGPKVTSITGCSIDNDEGSVALTFTVKNVDDLQGVKKSIADAKYFTPSYTLSATKDTNTGNYNCTLALAVNSFQPYVSEKPASGEATPEESSANGGASSRPVSSEVQP